MDHGTLRELAAGAALDDLDPGERRAFDAHVASCRACASLSRDLDDVLGELALAAPTLTPPVSLRRSVVGLVGADDEVPVRLRPLPEVARPLEPARRWRLGTFGALATAAVLAVVAIGLGAQAVRLGEEVIEARSELDERAAALAVMVDPAHRTASLTAEPIARVANAVVIFRPGSTEAFVMADQLPPTPAGKVYQLWYADESGVHPLGTFHHDGDGPFLARFGVDLASSAAAMITLEPEGGAVGEPGPQVVFGEL
jgi:Anti-sigma-K factor rskA/Putative zinc-finger